ncbi:MAG: hypothetical protein KC561_01795 [Myxococcales bacterium]|nr:hypothetical protein [Myxococcales bacterium]
MQRELRHHWTSIGTLILLVSLALSVACGDDDGPLSQYATDAGSDGSRVGDALEDVTDATTRDVGSEVAASLDDSDAPGEPVVRPRFTVGESFFSTPWPSNARRLSNGAPDLAGFPMRNIATLDINASLIEDQLDGFAILPTIFFPFEADPEDLLLPLPADTLESGAVIQLLDVREEHCGERVPVMGTYRSAGDRFSEDHLLIVSTVPGFALDSGATYAAVVLDQLGTERNELFDAALQGQSDDEWSESLAPLRACVEGAGLELEDILVASVFTTQDVYRTMDAMRDFVRDPEEISEISLTEFTTQTMPDGRIMYRATMQVPYFIEGEPPYNTGGGFQFDGDGVPIVQQWQSSDIAIMLPWEPETGERFPVMLYLPGTGGQLYWSVNNDWQLAAEREGFAVAAFDGPFHGSRSLPNQDSGSPGTTVNFASERVRYPQQVIEAVFFIRLLQELSEGEEGMPLNLDELVVGGQSQGAHVGAILAGLVPEPHSYALNGIGGYVGTLIMNREINGATFSEIFETLFGLEQGSVDQFHPMLALAQMGAELSDPAAYAARWRGWADNPDGADIFLINGIDDEYVPSAAAAALTVAGRVTPLAEPAWAPDPTGTWSVEPVETPVQGTDTAWDGSDLTIITEMREGEGHFVIWNDSGLQEAVVEFWQTSLVGAARLPHD